MILEFEIFLRQMALEKLDLVQELEVLKKVQLTDLNVLGPLLGPLQCQERRAWKNFLDAFKEHLLTGHDPLLVSGLR